MYWGVFNANSLVCPFFSGRVCCNQSLACIIGDGLLTFDEIEHAMNGENSETEVQKYLRSVQCPVLNALASRDQKKTRQAFNKMDTGKKYMGFR